MDRAANGRTQAVTDEKATSMSVHNRMTTRMQILVLEARLGRAVRAEEAALNGAAIEKVREVMDKHLPAWQEIQTLREKLSAPHSYPEGDVTSLICDEPVFGEHNPPEPDEYLYHYTRAWTLPKIRKNRSLRFGPLGEMNDPQEALESNAFGMGLMGCQASRSKSLQRKMLSSRQEIGRVRSTAPVAT
jgi:hypothetical protein